MKIYSAIVLGCAAAAAVRRETEEVVDWLVGLGACSLQLCIAVRYSVRSVHLCAISAVSQLPVSPYIAPVSQAALHTLCDGKYVARQ